MFPVYDGTMSVGNTSTQLILAAWKTSSKSSAKVHGMSNTQ
jgi:hypothetical protein